MVADSAAAHHASGTHRPRHSLAATARGSATAHRPTGTDPQDLSNSSIRGLSPVPTHTPKSIHGTHTLSTLECKERVGDTRGSEWNDCVGALVSHKPTVQFLEPTFRTFPHVNEKGKLRQNG